jgi:hypothetical protein
MDPAQLALLLPDPELPVVPPRPWLRSYVLQDESYLTETCARFGMWAFVLGGLVAIAAGGAP